MNGRIALVTGASRGLGRAVAIDLAAAGVTVVAIARTQALLESLDDMIRAAGHPPPILCPMDLTDRRACEALAQALGRQLPRLDLMVAAAAQLGELGPVALSDTRVWEAVLAINVIANQRLIAACHPLLAQSAANPAGGDAIFVTCGQAHSHTPFWGPYGVSKTALEAMVRTYQAEAARTGPRVHLFDPGPMRTRLRSQAMPGEPPTTQPDPADAARRLVAIWRWSAPLVIDRPDAD